MSKLQLRAARSAGAAWCPAVTLRAAVLLLTGAVALSGCTGDGSDTPSVAGSGASSQTEDLASLPYSERSVVFYRRCMIDKGWTVTTDADGGGANTEVPPDQRAAFDRDGESCAADFEQMFPPVKLTEPVLRDLYRQELEAMACLEREGYPPAGEPISEQAYVDAYLNNEPPSWSAYQAYSGDTMGAIEAKCPQPSVD